jgi:oligopeptidase B
MLNFIKKISKPLKIHNFEQSYHYHNLTINMKDKKYKNSPLNRIIGGVLLGSFTFLGACNQVAKEQTQNVGVKVTDVIAPKAKQIAKEMEIHGHKRTDNYYWLNDRENPEVITYLNEENKYRDTLLAHTKEIQDNLFAELKGRIKEVDESVPYKLDDYYYYYRYEEGQQYAIFCRKKGSLTGTEEILANGNEMAKGKKFFNAAYSVSPKHDILVMNIDTSGRNLFVLSFKDIATGKVYPETLPLNTSNAWANDNKTVFYTVKDATTLRSYKVYKHILGTEVAKDVLLYEEKDVKFSTYLGKSKSKKYLFLYNASTLSSEVMFLDADKPTEKFKAIQPRTEKLEYDVEHFGDKFYITTNDNSLNFKLVETPVTKTTKENWTDVIPHRQDVLLKGIEIFKDYLVLSEQSEGLPKMRVIKWADKSEHYLNFGEAAYNASQGYNPEFDTKILRYSYTSLTTPNSTIDYNMETKEKDVKKEQEVLGGFNKADYETERVFVTAKDGTKVPLSIVYKKGFKKDGSQPFLLYAYGSYGYSTNASFSSSRLALLNRGFGFAIAHIRGGQEMGRQWYEDGKFLKKKNTFTDFIDCADYLVTQKYTSPDRLVAKGGSAGGLLMGAVANMRPDLFKVVIANVPFVDVVTTMLDETLPLTTGEFEEWGNPKDKEYYDYMLSYSPYDQVEKKAYPNMLVTTGLHDSQVQYFEPAKWVAKLREMKTDNNKLIMSINMDAGHGGASGRFDYLKEVALEYAFIFDVLGVKM